MSFQGSIVTPYCHNDITTLYSINVILLCDTMLLHCAITTYLDVWQCYTVPLQLCSLTSQCSILAIQWCIVPSQHSIVPSQCYMMTLQCNFAVTDSVMALLLHITMFHYPITVLNFDIPGLNIKITKIHCAIIVLHCSIQYSFVPSKFCILNQKITLCYYKVEFDWATIGRSSLCSVMMMEPLSVVIPRMSVNYFHVFLKKNFQAEYALE